MNGRQAQVRNDRRGFTLIEILIAVTILGILAGVVIPQFTDASDDAAKAAFITSGRRLVESAERYRLENGQFLEDSGCGQVPDGFEDYVRAEQWLRVTPIRGLWDTEFNDNGVTSSIGVHFHGGAGAARDEDFMREIDAMIDDGVLATGGFREIADDRYHYIIAE